MKRRKLLVGDELAMVKRLLGVFIWSFGHEFFIEAEEGNFIWSDAEYEGGNDCLYSFKGNYGDWLKELNIPFGRDKGTHIIGDYCRPFQDKYDEISKKVKQIYHKYE